MGMTISKSFEQNVPTGPFQFSKIGITIHSDKQINSPGELQEHSSKLNKLAKMLIQKELEEIKIEHSNKLEA